MGQQITDKKLKNKKFRKTEKAIIEAFFSSKKFLGARVIAKRAKISRSTLYRHHKTPFEIVPDYEEYILSKYHNLMKCLISNKAVKIRAIYYQMLIFILKNKDIFKLVIDRGNGQLLEKMIRKIGPRIIETYKLPKNCDKMLRIYEKEITGVLEDYIKNDFVEDELAILDNIIYLTNTLRQRLMPLVK